MEANGIFITGTDTEAGKTVAGAALLSILRAQGVDTVPMKPIQTGCTERDGIMSSPDLQFCLDMAELGPISAEERQRMEVYQFLPACSPHLAAADADCRIDFSPIVTALQWLQNRHQCVLVEGAGGVMVPIAGSLTMLNLMQTLELPVILVARPGLGTLNHTLLSLRVMRQAGLQVLGVIICATRPLPWGWIEKDNRRTIENLGETPVLGCLPFIPGVENGQCTAEELRRVATERIDLDSFCDRLSST